MAVNQQITNRPPLSLVVSPQVRGGKMLPSYSLTHNSIQNKGWYKDLYRFALRIFLPELWNNYTTLCVIECVYEVSIQVVCVQKVYYGIHTLCVGGTLLLTCTIDFVLSLLL